MAMSRKEFLVWAFGVLLNVTFWLIYFAYNPVPRQNMADGEIRMKVPGPLLALVLINIIWILGMFVIRMIAPTLNGHRR